MSYGNFYIKFRFLRRGMFSARKALASERRKAFFPSGTGASTMMRKPKWMIALGLALSLGATACGEASFTGKGGKKNDPKSQNENPDVPLIPSGTNPGATGSTGSTETTPGTQTPGTENPKNPETPGTDNPNVPTVPEGGDPTPDCVTQNGRLIQCPNDITTSPSQN